MSSQEQAPYPDHNVKRPTAAPSLTERLQQKCSDWKTYWRAPDAHGVILSPEQAVELLQDALGVEVEIAHPSPENGVE